MGIGATIEALRYRTPIGWKQLMHSPSRLFVACTGVAFANILILMMWGLSATQISTIVRPIDAFKADIFLVGPSGNNLTDSGTIPRRRLDQALSLPGVAEGTAINIGNVSFRNPATKGTQKLSIFGVDPESDVMADPEISGQRDKLKVADTVLLDRAARGDFSAIVERIKTGELRQIELMGRTVSIEGMFKIGGSFSTDGVVIASDQTFMRLVPMRAKGAVSAVILKVTPGYSPEVVAADLRRLLPSSDTKVLTMEEFRSNAIRYSRGKSPIGIMFTSAMLLGFVVGMVIVYQILSADVAAHLGEYATFKAMGYTDGYLLGIVFEEALILALIGFVPGFIGRLCLYELLRYLSGIPITMPIDRGVTSFGFTVVMCFVSGAIATRRLAAADPADVFG